jgi:hypothetical protein
MIFCPFWPKIQQKRLKNAKNCPKNAENRKGQFFINCPII